MGFNVFVTRKIPQPGLALLAQHCETVEVNPFDRVLTREELIEKVRDRDGILCMLTDRIDEEVLVAARGARGFANLAVGFDNIEVQKATALGFMVSNTPGVLTEATAELTWALILATARHLPQGDHYTRQGKFRNWSPTLFLGLELHGKTLGIIGAGRIGTAVALRARGFAMNVVYDDLTVNPQLEQEVNARKLSLHDLLQQSDVVSLHVSLTPQSRHLLGEEQLRLLKPTAILINTSRGAVIDERALLLALKERWFAAAGLDVYEKEPELTPGLTELDNVVLLPHLGSATHHTRERMAMMAAENLVAMLHGEVPPNLVNPEVLEREGL